MAATLAVVTNPRVPGHLYETIVELTGDTSYPTGGYPFGIAQIQALFSAYMSIDSVDVVNVGALGQPATTCYLAGYDRTAQKVQFYGGAAGSGAVFAEVTATTNVSTAVARLRVRLR
jgi:hypothetical protein